MLRQQCLRTSQAAAMKAPLKLSARSYAYRREDFESSLFTDRPDHNESVRPRDDRDDGEPTRYRDRRNESSFSRGRDGPDYRSARSSRYPDRRDSFATARHADAQRYSRPNATERQSYPRTSEVNAALQYLYGTNAILAALKAKNRTLFTLFTAPDARHDHPLHQSLLATARACKLEVLSKSRGELDRLSNGKPHNNVVLSCSALPRQTIEALGSAEQGFRPVLAKTDAMSTDITYTGSASTAPPVYVLLDEVTDPQNMGSILRSAYFLGCAGVILSARNCCSITAAVAKVSSGASEFVPIYHTESAVSFIKQSRKDGWRCVATVGREEAALLRSKKQLTSLTSLAAAKQQQPVLLVLGSEGSGLRTNVKNACTTMTSIASPVKIESSVESLNVGVAAAILLHQLLG